MECLFDIDLDNKLELPQCKRATDQFKLFQLTRNCCEYYFKEDGPLETQADMSTL